MTVTAPPRPPVPLRADDPEALIEEARTRQRRRRRRIFALVVIAAAFVGLGYGIDRIVPAGTSGVVQLPNGPRVNVHAFADHGVLAFVSHNTLWLLDGADGSLHQLPTAPGYVPTHPVFSADGKWLAYLVQRVNQNTGSSTTRLWIASANGRHARVVPGLVPVGIYGWSPQSDLLAVSAGPERTKQPCPCYSPTTLRLITPGGASRTLVRGPWIYSAAWSPSGTAIAVGIEGAKSLSRSPGGDSILATYPVAGGKPTIWLRLPASAHLNGMTGVLIDAAGWWKRFGIGFWVFGDGMVHNNDETALDLIAAPGRRPHPIAQTLSDGTTDVIAAASQGELAVVADVSHGRGGGRDVWDKKQVRVCTPSGGCRGLVSRQSKVTADPVWSPDGSKLAFVEAPDYADPGWPQKVLQRWYDDHRLLLYDARTGTRRGVPAATGATVPVWSANGKSLLYISHDGLWLLPTLSAQPVEIASPLFLPNDWPAYYGQIAWGAQFAWSS